MIAKPRFTLMAVTVFTVLALSIVMTVPAFADDSAPPPPVDTPTEVVPPVDEPVVVDVPPAEVVVSPDVVSPDATIPEVLAQAPEGTDVQVVDKNGESLPLASQEAADAVATGDPIWCPVGIAPKANTGGCSASYTSLQDLINDLLNAGGVTNPAKAGVIWIAASYNSAVNDSGVPSFVLNGDDFDDGDLVFTDTMDNFALTIKGGWSGLNLSTVVNQNTPSAFTGASLSIINWKGNISLSDILFDGTASNTPTDDAALLVQTTGNIQLDRVTVKDSLNGGAGAMTGAALENQNSTKAATVIVNNGIFENNEGDGLHIQSAGIVTITSLFANGNDVAGAVIDNTFNVSTTPDKAVTLKGSLEFNNNAGAGLTVNSKGLITISNIMASANGSNGVDLDNTTSLTTQGVTLNGTNSFVSNAIGLNVRTHGNFLANNISAIDNHSSGAYIDNCDVRLPDGSCRALVAKTLKLTGYNYFNNNGFFGLELYSFGVITISNLTASGNSFNGALLDNERPNIALVQVDSIGTITLTGYGIFNDNNGNGLETNSHGNITLPNLSANNNTNNGVLIRARRTNVGTKIYVANVILTGVNSFNKNGTDGLHISADGKITLSNVVASYNVSGDGADLTTGADINITEKGYGVAISGTNTFSENGSNGLLVHATGAISVNNLSANGNGVMNPAPPFGSGATLDNCNLNTIPDPDVCTPTTAYGVTLTGYVNVSDNFLHGLQIDSLGAITLGNVLASGNTGVGVRIQNKYNPLFNKLIVRGVTLTGTNIFSDNNSTGLVILSYGAIALSNIHADNNGDDSPGSTSGAYLNNEVTGTTITAKNITISGVNSFNGNYLWGLEFHSNGTATLSRINANGNDWGPANTDLLHPSYTGGGVLGSAKNITLTCGHMFGNGIGTGVGLTDPAVGYNLTATGVLTFKGIYSSGNNGIDNPINPVPSKVIITRACALP